MDASSLGFVCVYYYCVRQILSFKTEKLKNIFEWYIKLFKLQIFFGKIILRYFFSCLLK